MTETYAELGGQTVVAEDGRQHHWRCNGRGETRDTGAPLACPTCRDHLDITPSGVRLKRGTARPRRR